ncbi:MAG: hypothetical protein WC343_02830 [Bacilli bacterium]|jgi:predicted nucleic acid-binding Zn ribbon protein
MNNYKCENCGKAITKEEYYNRCFNSFCEICLKLNKKQRLQRALKMFESKSNNI